MGLMKTIYRFLGLKHIRQLYLLLFVLMEIRDFNHFVPLKIYSFSKSGIAIHEYIYYIWLLPGSPVKGTFGKGLV